MTKILEQKAQLIPRVAGFLPPSLINIEQVWFIKSVDSIFKEYFNRLINKRANQINDTLLVLVKVNSIIKKVTNKFMGLI